MLNICSCTQWPFACREQWICTMRAPPWTRWQNHVASLDLNFQAQWVVIKSVFMQGRDTEKNTLTWISVWRNQIRSVAQSCPTLCEPMNHSTPGLPVHHQLPEFTQTHVHRVSDAIQPSHPLSSLLHLPPIPPSIRVFSNESTLRMRWTKYWSFSFSIIPSKEIPGLISFRLDWLGLRAVQGTLKSLLQHHTSKASFFGTQLSL